MHPDHPAPRRRGKLPAPATRNIKGTNRTRKPLRPIEPRFIDPNSHEDHSSRQPLSARGPAQRNIPNANIHQRNTRRQIRKTLEEWATRRSRRHANPYLRRITAAALAALAVVGAAGVGVYVQYATGGDDDWALYNSFPGPVDYSSATAIAIEDEPDPEAGSTTIALRRASTRQSISSAPAPGGHKRVFITTGGRQRQLDLWVPDSARMNNGEQSLAPRPLVIVYHGKDEQPSHMENYTQLSELMDAIVAYPYGDDLAWEGAPYAATSDGEDIQFTRDILDSVSNTYQVDDQRVYAAGMSNGGGFVLKLACEMPEEFSAIASVAGAFYPGSWQGCVSDDDDASGTDSLAAGKVRFSLGRAVPFLEIHGRKDGVINYRGGVRHGEHYLGAVQLSGLYASRSGCSGAPVSMQVSDKVVRVQWPGCQAGGEVTHLGIADAGHTWPGEPTGMAGSGATGTDVQSVEERTSKAITASSEIRAFFNRHQTRGR